MVKQNLSFADLNTLYLDNVLIRIELYIISESDYRNNRTELQSYLSSDHNHSVEKVTALINIGQRNNTISELKLYRVYLKQRIDILRLPDFFCSHLLLNTFIFNLGNLYRTGNNSSDNNEDHTQGYEYKRIKGCCNSKEDDYTTNQIQYLGNTEELPDKH